jgi:ribose-phosphate pyrophosphokinase
MQEEPLLFAMAASGAYGMAVAQHAGIALAPLEERSFEDGEHKSRPLCSVRGRDVYVIHSLYGDAEQSANDKLVRLLFVLAALRDGGAARLTAICPYLAYARKDRRTKPRDPVTTRYVAALFESVHIDCMVALDVHNLAAYQNAFRCRTEHLEAAGMFAQYLAPMLGDSDVVVVSPDAGGIKRADVFRQRLARVLGRPVGAAFAEKYRSAGVVSGEAFVGDVDGKVAVVIDDLISAGTTIARVAAACHAHGASRIVAAASHGVFAAAANATLGASGVERVIVTDTIPPWRVSDPRLREKLVQLSTTALVAGAIRALHDNGSMTALAEP